ncbi:MAG TPA: hypothetical protein VEW42_02060 [Candidatus Eisenbacteria bacterium]|nr:hypothetical protein [Candidatus Eisenbacteria bacterium]
MSLPRPDFRGIGDQVQERQAYCLKAGRNCLRRCNATTDDQETISNNPKWADDAVRETQYGRPSTRASNIEKRIQDHRNNNSPDNLCAYLNAD